MASKTQIVATIGPASWGSDTLPALIAAGMDIARFNFAWSTGEELLPYIEALRASARSAGCTIPIIQDLPGPRVQKEDVHTYDASLPVISESDEVALKFGAEIGLEYAALSFVGTAQDVIRCKEIISEAGGHQRVIAKIERRIALDFLDAIIAEADAVMVARGDLGEELPLEEIPFVQADIIRRAKAAGKPVIVATQMMLSMTEHEEPTRAEVTDVANAILSGADAVMLSEESASGKYPLQAVAMMERIALAAERHLAALAQVNPLS